MEPAGLVAEVGCRFTLHDPAAKGWSGWLDCEVFDVSWTLSDHPDGTRARLGHTGFQGWSGMIAGTMLRFGWKGLLKTKLANEITSANE